MTYQISAEDKARIDAVYDERNALVAALSKIFPSTLERHPAHEEWEEDWRWIVFIEAPTGQMTWHIHDSELPNFAHLERSTGKVWDGHTTVEKYERLARLPSLLTLLKPSWSHLADVQRIG